MRNVFCGLALILSAACASAVEVDASQAHLFLRGDKKGHVFNEKETQLLTKVFEKLRTAPDESGKKVECKPHGWVKVNHVRYDIIADTAFLIEKTQQFVWPPKDVREKLTEIVSDNSINDENRTALFVYVLKEWVREEAKK